MLNPGEVLERMREGEVRFGRYRIHFRDRGREVEGFLNRALAEPGIRIVYGPYGAGKSTFLRKFAGAASKRGGLYIKYINFGKRSLEELLGSVLPGIDNRAINREIIRDAKELDVFGMFVRTADIVWKLVDLAVKEAEEARAERLVIFLDDVDKYMRGKGDRHYNALFGLLNALADSIENPEEDVWDDFVDKHANVVVAISDQAAVDVAEDLGDKGLAMYYLLWNLPRRAFEEVVEEVAGLTGARNIDVELLWNLIGGNLRGLEQLVINYGWDVRRWLGERVIRRVIDAFSGVGREELGGGRIQRRLLRRNIVIRLSVPGGSSLSELPSEPWVMPNHTGGYAYQVPAYYWVVRVVQDRKSLSISPDDVLNQLRK